MERREKILLSALALIALLLVLIAPAFFAPQPLLSLATSKIPALLAVIGCSTVILTRQIDISIGSIMGISAVVIGHLNHSGIPMPLATCAGAAVGASIGMLNGALVSVLRLPSIVVTLATMVIGAESLRLAQQGQFIPLNPGAQWFGLDQTVGQLALILFGFGLLLLCDFLMRHLRAGRWFHATGSNAESARLAGVNPTRTTFIAFVLNGLTAGLAAACSVAQSPQVDPKCGVGMELTAIAAAVIGGISVRGGTGSLRGAALGLALISAVNPTLTYLHVQAYWEKAIQGIVILLSVLAETKRTSRTNPPRA